MQYLLPVAMAFMHHEETACSCLFTLSERVANTGFLMMVLIDWASAQENMSIFNEVLPKQALAATEARWTLEILDLETRD